MMRSIIATASTGNLPDAECSPIPNLRRMSCLSWSYMDSHRVEKTAPMQIALGDADAEIAPFPTDGGGRKPEPDWIG
jgi:hypothetical protein